MMIAAFARASRVLPDSPPGYWLELIVPFLPMAFVAAGAVLLVNNASRNRA